MKNIRLSDYQVRVRLRRMDIKCVEVMFLMSDFLEDINIGIPNHELASVVAKNPKYRERLKTMLDAYGHYHRVTSRKIKQKIKNYEKWEEKRGQSKDS